MGFGWETLFPSIASGGTGRGFGQPERDVKRNGGDTLTLGAFVAYVLAFFLRPPYSFF